MLLNKRLPDWAVVKWIYLMLNLVPSEVPPVWETFDKPTDATGQMCNKMTEPSKCSTQIIIIIRNFRDCPCRMQTKCCTLMCISKYKQWLAWVSIKFNRLILISTWVTGIFVTTDSWEFAIFWLTSRSSTVSKSVRISVSRPRMNPASCPDHHWWAQLCVWLRPRDEPQSLQWEPTVSKTGEGERISQAVTAHHCPTCQLCPLWLLLFSKLKPGVWVIVADQSFMSMVKLHMHTYQQQQKHVTYF